MGVWEAGNATLALDTIRYLGWVRCRYADGQQALPWHVKVFFPLLSGTDSPPVDGMDGFGCCFADVALVEMW